MKPFHMFHKTVITSSHDRAVGTPLVRGVTCGHADGPNPLWYAWLTRLPTVLYSPHFDAGPPAPPAQCSAGIAAGGLRRVRRQLGLNRSFGEDEQILYGVFKLSEELCSGSHERQAPGEMQPVNVFGQILVNEMALRCGR
eukprot:6176495-Pleurochrysis_carterae.AAC.2